MASASEPAPRLTEEYFLDPVTAASEGRFSFPALTPPFTNRATYRYSLGRNAWAFEQLLTFANVTATIRSNVLLLNSGGLWVHSPQWPTEEFCKLLDDIGHPVEHVVLPCNAFEHKAPMKAFIHKYPEASVWVSPGQYGPLGTCGRSMEERINLGYKVDGIFGDDNNLPPWVDEFDIATLFVDIPQNAGPVSEVAFCHRATKTLIATDAVTFIPGGPSAPDIFSTYFNKETVLESTFWARTVLQSVFLPLRTGRDGNYPGFEAIKDRLIRAPILRGFVDARAPTEVRTWVESIAVWEFDRIITSHFASPISASPHDFVSAFSFLGTNGPGMLPPITCVDWELLDSLNQVIAENKLGAPAIYDYKSDCSK